MKSKFNLTAVLLVAVSTLHTVPPTAIAMMDERDLKPTPQKKTPEQKNRTITINTKITENMIRYSYFGASYKPDFSLKVNNQELRCSESKKVTLNENKMKVRYDYNFSGFKKGAKEVVFEVPNDIDTVDVTFSWDNRWRVVANNAKPRKIKVIA